MAGQDSRTQAVDTVPNNLGVQLTPFIGREKEVETSCGLLRQEGVRLLTLTGPGGAGKTRLGTHVATELLQDFPDGVFFVGLASINDPALVAASIAQVLGVVEIGNRSLVDSLKGHLHHRRILLLLDNFEQVLDAAPLVVDLLTSSLHARALVTSRSRLHVRGEYELPVPPLSVPPDTRHLPSVDHILQYEAVRLFIQRARALMPGFAVTGDNAAAVAQICTRLDGLPLAIELAAARIKILTPQGILARMQSHTDGMMRLLVAGERDLPVRQQTLRNTIGWSYDLLSAEDRTLFRRLSVFRGSYGLDAVEAICGAPGAIDLLEGMASLVDKNLVQRVRPSDAEPQDDARFTILETIQEFARDQLQESGEMDWIQRLHADYFLSLAETAEPELRGPKQVEWLNRLEVEHDNMRAALRWALDTGQASISLRLASSLMQFWKMHGHLSEGRSWLDRALSGNPENAAPIALRAKALMAAGTLATAHGDLVQATAFLEESLALFRELGDKPSIVIALKSLGNEARFHGDYEAARAHLQEGLDTAREIGDNWAVAAFLGDLGIVLQTLDDTEAARSFYGQSLAARRELKDKRGIAMMLVNLGELARAEGDYAAAHSLYTEGLGIAQELGDRLGVGMVLHNLGHVAYHQGQHDQARKLFAESLSIFYEMGNKRDIPYCLAALAGVFGAQRQPERAAMLFAAAQMWANTVSSHLDPADLIEYERNLAAARAQLPPEQWTRFWRKGQEMSLDQAVTYALEEVPPPPPVVARPAEVPAVADRDRATRILGTLETSPLGEPVYGLTERELEVLTLVAQGLTDHDVGESLTISPRTVQRHLSSIYSKMGVSTRTAAARLAVQRKLV